jgi:hypothetical protein
MNKLTHLKRIFLKNVEIIWMWLRKRVMCCFETSWLFSWEEQREIQNPQEIET